MKDFRGKLAIVTGTGTGMGRELARRLASEGCHVALCDVLLEEMAETKQSCEKLAPPGTRITAHACDVSDEAQVLAFRDAVKQQHDTDHVHLLFNNAGMGGGGSFLEDDRHEWERTFGVCWYGVYYCSRAFMPLLVASDEACIVNTSSVNGFWGVLGPGIPHTAYSTAKFAVKGFSEALLTDLRLNAPHVKVCLVMPGHVGTSIAINTGKLLGKPAPLEMTTADVTALCERLKRQGLPIDGLSDDQLKAILHQRMLDFRDKAPLSAAEAATIILDGVRNEQWRILVGDDARTLDRLVRESPEEAYEPSFWERLHTSGVLAGPSVTAEPR
jgi:NAD(P)-dependent dehydrogenase (short-subunit alcohol dehydrogenase family)